MGDGEIGRLYITIGSKLDELKKALADAKGQLGGLDTAVKKTQETFAESCQKMGQSFKDFGKPLMLAGAAITGAFALAIKKTADMGDEFKDLAQRTGIAVETLSSFKLAADKSGTSVQGFATGMKGLSRVMYDAATGGKEAQQTFKDIGVSATDSAGNLRPLDQVMLDVADRFAGMADGAEKNALAMKLFGKAGMDLIPMLNLGRKGLQENIDAMQKYGVVTREEAEAGDAFNDAMKDLGAATSGLSRAIAGTLIPALTNLLSGTADAIAKVSAWAREHKGLTTVLSGGVFAIGATATALGTLAYGVGTVISQLPKLIAGFKAIAAFASKAMIFNFLLAGTAIVAIGVAKMISDFKALREEGKTTAEALSALAPKFNPFNNLSRENMGKFLTDMDAARDKSINLKGALYLLGEAFRAIKGAIEQGTTTPILNLGEALKGLGIKTRTELTAELTNAQAALKLLKGSVESTPGAIQALRDRIAGLKEQLYGTSTQMTAVKTAIVGILPPARDLTALWARLTATMVTTLPAARDLAGVLEAVGAAIPKDLKIPPVDTKDAKQSIRSFAQEVSTVVADSMREIARSIVGAFNIKKLFGAVAIDIKFDSSSFDALTDAAESAYRKISDAASEEYDGIYKTKRREYEDARDLIENSVMDEGKKREALKKLDRDYEDSIDLLKKEEKGKLLAIEEQHKLDLDKIRKDEDTARQKLADDEEKRQGSLWFKVKGIVATAIEEIATAWLTSNILKNIGGIFDGIADKAGKALGDEGVTGKVKGLGATIGEFITGIGTGIGGFISGLAAGIGTAIVSLATAIAQAATILAAAAPAIITVGLIALGLMAGIKLLGSIFGSGGGAGAGDGMGRVVERQDKQLAILQSLIDFCRNNIGPALLIAGVDYMAKTMDAANQAVRWLDTINGSLKGMKGASSGAVVTMPQMVMTHGTPTNPEYILRPNQLQKLMATGGGGASSGSSIVLSPTFNINAIDRAGVESFIRNDAKPILQRMLDHYDLTVRTGGVRG